MSFFRLTPGVASSVFFWSLWHLAQTISDNIGVLWGVDGRMEEDACCRILIIKGMGMEDLFLEFYAGCTLEAS